MFFWHFFIQAIKNTKQNDPITFTRPTIPLWNRNMLILLRWYPYIYICPYNCYSTFIYLRGLAVILLSFIIFLFCKKVNIYISTLLTYLKDFRIFFSKYFFFQKKFSKKNFFSKKSKNRKVLQISWSVEKVEKNRFLSDFNFFQKFHLRLKIDKKAKLLRNQKFSTFSTNHKI